MQIFSLYTLSGLIYFSYYFSLILLICKLVFYPSHETEWWFHRCLHGPLTSYAKLRVAYAPGMPGTFSLKPRVGDPDMQHGTCVTHVPWCIPGSLTSAFLWSWWRGKRLRRMRNPQFCVSGKRLIFDDSHWYLPRAKTRWSLCFSPLKLPDDKSCAEARHTCALCTAPLSGSRIPFQRQIDPWVETLLWTGASPKRYDSSFVFNILLSHLDLILDELGNGFWNIITNYI